MDEINDPAIETVVLKASSQVGKALASDTPIATPSGWTTMADIAVGDEVFDESGKTCRVAFVTPVMRDRECFRLTFSDGSEIVADANHRWFVHDGHRAKANYKVITTADIANTCKFRKGKTGKYSNRYAVQVAAPLIDLPSSDLPIDPYVLGQWIGNGNSYSAQITCHAKDASEIAEYIRAAGHTVIERRIDKRPGSQAANLQIDPYTRGAICTRGHDANTTGLTKKGYCAECARQFSKAHQYGSSIDPVSHPVESLARSLSAIGLLSTPREQHPKHIPAPYLRSGIDQRIALLQGLMDSDGHISAKSGRSELSTSSDALAAGFGDLLSGLGIKYTRKLKHPQLSYRGARITGSDAWRFSFMVYSDKAIFRLQRKRELLPQRAGRRTTETERRRMISVTRVPSVPVRCIQVDSPSHLYLAGRNMIPTHNTEMLLNITGYFMHQDPCPIMLIEPTLEIAEAYSKDRLAPMIRDTPVLRDLISEPRTRDGTNTLLHKAFRGGHVTLVGANSPSGLASRPIRIILADEISRYLPSAGTEGNPLRLADRRATTFWNRKKIYVSSPGILGLCNVTREFEFSDQQFFHVPCYSCGKGQVMEFKQLHWDAGRPDTAHYVCPHCSATWNDAQRIEAVMAAEDEGFGWAATAEFRGVAGHAIWAIYSPWMSHAEIATTYVEAKHALDQGDPEPLKTWTNTVEGRAWVEMGQRANPDPLVERLENYSAESLPWQVLYLTAAIDTQDDRLEVKIVGWRAENRVDPPEAWVILHKILYGDPAQTELWTDVDELLMRDYRTMDGRILRVSVTAVDTGGHHAEAAYRFCNKRLARRVYAIKGAPGARPIWPPRAGSSKKYKGTKVFILGVDTAKDAIHARLKVAVPGPGYIHFPVTSEASGTFDLKYFQQLTCEYVKTKFIRGHAVREWFKPIGARNESFDLMVYNLSSLLARPVPWEILARNAPKEEPAIEVTDKPSGTPAPAPVAAPPARPRARPIRLRMR